MIRTLQRTCALVSLVTSALAVAGCTSGPSREEFEFDALQFEDETFQAFLEGRYSNLTGSRSPPWTDSDAVDQLGLRIQVDAVMDEAFGAIVARHITENGVVVKKVADRPGTVYYVEVPPFEAFNVGESLWRIEDLGGYRYENKEAAQVASCLGLEYRAGGYDCPLD